MTKNKLFHLFFYVGYTTIIAGAILQIASWKYAPYIFSTGAVFTIIFRFLTLESNNDFRIKRMNSMMALGALLLMATAYFMFKQENSWALTLAIATVIDLVVSFRYPSHKK